MASIKLFGRNKKSLSVWTKQKLRITMVLFFIFLTIPTVILIYQAYSQLKWEAFYQHRVMAEALVQRIDEHITKIIDTESNRAFTEYTFLNVTGDENINFLQRSPLAIFPLKLTTPGIIGYFQIDPQGDFSTPLLPYPLPAGQILRQDYGLSDQEATQRMQSQDEIYRLLRDNQLITVQSVKEESTTDNLIENRLRETMSSPARQIYEFDAIARDGASVSIEEEDLISAQFGFDNLQKKSDQPATYQALKPGSIGRISDLKLENQYRKQLAIAEKNVRKDADKYSRQKQNKLKRTVRKEQSVLPAQKSRAASSERKLSSSYTGEKESPSDGNEEGKKQRSLLDSPSFKVAPAQSFSAQGFPTQGFPTQVSMFESEIDAFQMNMLDSGHLVIYRNGWRDGQRYIQGLLIETEIFIDVIVTANFMQTKLAETSDLTTAYQGNVISVLSNTNDGRYLSSARDLQGSLLLQQKLSVPLDDMELIFSINSLPAGPGAIVINWLTAVFMLVLSVGILLMYRLGLKQIIVAQQQQDFISAVSHELKTPLTSIRMYGEMLREGWAPEDKKRTYYDYIYDESERLTRLINNVLQLSRMTRNELQLNLVAIPIPQLMDTLRSKISSQIEHGGFELIINCELERQNVAIDTDSFIQVIINLVDNAIKFSAGSTKKMIVIDCKAVRAGIQFSVRDYGPGIEKDQMARIFQLFYRSENELTRDTVGTGIGLALVHQLVLAMNGEIDVVNANPGAEFRVTFPVIST
ncbi:MAG: HAMP domain-containing histidine kinase [Flavobacteriales bacterium]|nr:HAMP domain-containing histidine kinase [Flavobacteriales bacterium]